MSTVKSKEKSNGKEKRRSPGGFGITKRRDKYEATYNIPKSQLPPGSPRKRITIQGDGEAVATAALLEKLQAPTLLSGMQEEEMRRRLGSDGILEAADYMEPDTREKGPTLAQWVEEWKIDWMSDDLQESTKKIYFGHINNYILPYVGKPHLDDLSARVLKHDWWD